MIDDFLVNKAFLDKLSSITSSQIAVQGQGFEPSPESDYIAEKVVPTTTDITMGATGQDTQRGFYQVTICTPISKNKFYHLSKLQPISSAFTKGLSAAIEFNGQKISIGAVTPSGIYSDATHIKTALTIDYTVIS